MDFAVTEWFDTMRFRQHVEAGDGCLWLITTTEVIGGDGALKSSAQRRVRIDGPKDQLAAILERAKTL